MFFCRQSNSRIEYEEIESEDREAAVDWVISNQLGRRNLTLEQLSYYRGLQYEREKAKLIWQIGPSYLTVIGNTESSQAAPQLTGGAVFNITFRSHYDGC